MLISIKSCKEQNERSNLFWWTNWTLNAPSPCAAWLQIQIVAEGIGWSWIVKLLIWASRVTLVLKDIKQSSGAAGVSLVPDCQIRAGNPEHALLTSKAADTCDTCECEHWPRGWPYDWSVRLITGFWLADPGAWPWSPHCQGSPDHYWAGSVAASPAPVRTI